MHNQYGLSAAGRDGQRSVDLTRWWRWEEGVCEKGKGEVPVAKL